MAVNVSASSTTKTTLHISNGDAVDSNEKGRTNYLYWSTGSSFK